MSSSSQPHRAVSPTAIELRRRQSAARTPQRIRAGGDAGLYRGQARDDDWLQFMQGNTPSEPHVPVAYQKYLHDLTAAGIHPVSSGGQLHLQALTDKDVDQLSQGRELKNAETLRMDKDLAPVPGGLFDPSLTGGPGASKWSHIKLHEPMPSPVMAEPIRHLLGLTEKKFEQVIAGQEQLNNETGPKAVGKALAEINIPREMALARVQMEAGKGTKRDTAVRKLRYLKDAQRLGLHPQDWMLSKVPVLPPLFRPVSVMRDTGTPLVSDANYLYRELHTANENLKGLAGKVEDVGQEHLALYKAFQAVVGLSDPVHPKLVEKKVRGILQHLVGSSPKFSTVQRRLLSTREDLVGRAVLTSSPDLDMDEVELPEDKAWETYKPFIIRRLTRQGMSLGEAARQATDRTPTARHELLNEVNAGPIMVNRAPVLHKFGLMGLRPRLGKGQDIKVSPLVLAGYGGDEDAHRVSDGMVICADVNVTVC